MSGPMTARTPLRFGRAVIALFGAVALVAAGMLPVWGTRLVAPQYPRGLDLWFFGGRAEGPIGEVNALNHYIGMRPIDLSIVPELALWPLAVVVSAVLFVIAVFVPGWPGRVSPILLALVPVAILADIQRWLIMFGTELDRTSALRLDPFTPLVVGPSTVWNFTIWTYPGPALALIWLTVLAALAARRLPASPVRQAWGVGIAGVLIAVVGTIGLVMPSVTTERGDGPEAVTAPDANVIDLDRLVASAPSGGTVVVPSGTYRAHLRIERPLSLVADGDVWLDGGGRGSVITVLADDVSIRGFRLSGTGGQVEEAAAIKAIDVDRLTLQDNRIEDAFAGIVIVGGAAVSIIDNDIEGSGQVSIDAGHASGSPPGTFEPNPATPDETGAADPHTAHGRGAGPGGQGDGISLWSVEGAVLRGNVVRAVRDAIYLNYVTDVLVDTNVVEQSRYAVHAMFGSSVTVFGNTIRENLSGLVFMYTTDVLAGRNLIADARSAGTGQGVVVKDVSGFRFLENVVAGNRVGIQAEGTVHRLDQEALVTSNVLVGNDVGVALMPSADIVFGGNVFDGNLTQVRALGPGVERRNTWSHAGVGNTWSDYAGFDLEGDGVGDVAYTSGDGTNLIDQATPALRVFHTSPAIAVMAVAQGVWDQRQQPTVIDHSPRTSQVGVEAAPRLQPAAVDPVAWWVVGLSMVLFAMLIGHLATHTSDAVEGRPGTRHRRDG